jgi:proton-coupled amino acid transporter
MDEDTEAFYVSYDDVQEAGDVTRDIAVMVHKAGTGKVRRSASLGQLQSYSLLAPEVGRASDFARPGGFRRQFVVASGATGSNSQLQSASLIEFYDAFASSILSLADITGKKAGRGPASSKSKTTIGVTHTVLAILKSFVGSAVLFLPKGFDNGGLVLSNILLMAMAVLTVFCVGRLLSCAQLLERRGFQDVEYSEIARVAMGPLGAHAVNASLVLSQLGFCCGYLIFIASNIRAVIWGARSNDEQPLEDILDNISSAIQNGSTHNESSLSIHNLTAALEPSLLPTSPPAWVLIAAQIPLFIAFAWVRRLSHFAVSNLAADGLIVLGLGIIFAASVHHLVTSPIPAPTRLFSSRFPLFLGTAAFTFEGIGLVLPIFSSMHPHLRPLLPTLLRDTLACVLVLFCLFASTVYAAYGENVSIIVTDNLPPQAAVPVRLAYSAALALSYPLMMYPVITIIESHLIPESSHVKPQLKWRKNALRALIVLASGFIAWLGFDTLDNFVALIGAFCSVPLAIIYPVLMHSKLAQASPSSAESDAPLDETDDASLSSFEKLSNWVVGSIGVGICVLSSAFAIWTWPR